MSWSISFDVKDRDLVDEEAVVNGTKNLSDEHAEQFAVAMLSMIDIVESGALGDPDGEFRVTFSGHGNPEHKKTPGWSNDGLSISIWQV